MSFKRFNLSTDIKSLVSYVNEVIAISGSIFSLLSNTKQYDNIASGSTELGGYFQTAYDSAPANTTSTPLFDMTYGYSSGSAANLNLTTLSSQTEKVKMYRHFASTLLGNRDSEFTINSAAASECFFLTFKRNIQKDEIKKGNVSIMINTDPATQGVAQYAATDEGAVTSFKQGPGGEYAPLKISGSNGTEVGQVWYNAGVIILPTDNIWGTSKASPINNGVAAWSASLPLMMAEYSSSLDELVDGLRAHIDRIDLHNQTNLHSTVYFARATNSEFNYSSNPTFTDDEQRIRVTSGSNILQTRTYITTIGLYDPNDNLLASAKLNKPITKSPDTESIFRVRLDY